jgi:hypothetical protein
MFAAVRPAPRLPWPARAAWAPALLAVVAWGWGQLAWREFARALGGHPHLPPWSLPAAVAGFVMLRFASFLGEAACYTLLWRALGCRIPLVRLACWIAACSLADLLAASLARVAAPHPHAAWAFAILLGARTAWRADGPLMHAFGGLGLVTALRIGLTAWAQARALGTKLAAPLAFTALLWAIARLIVGFGFALLRGPVGVT